jgi:alginate O-acetyltransferase complex protein AlgI
MDIISLKFAISAVFSLIVFYFIYPKYRIAYLTLLSCVFIASYSRFLLIYILLYAFINYFIGINIPNSKHKIALFRIGIIINILQLVLLRYASFVIDPVLQLMHSNVHVSILSSIVIPVGISYFTLQGIGYLINVKMGWEKPEKKILNFLLYITFYPKFLSGPIERSNHFLPQLKLDQPFNERQVSEGLRIALFGYLKKVAIANQLAPYIINTYSNLDSTDGLTLWIILILQPLYLYFDFSGYTDIAIGVAKTFGVELLPNFERPFFSENMTSFWKRFHISLSSWFNDYVFRQTSFKYRRWGVTASVGAVFVTWILFGIWHGAGWNFMLLGFIQALAIIYEFFTKKWRTSFFSKFPHYLKIIISRIFTYFFYGGSLIFFFSPDLNSAYTFISKMNKIEISIRSFLLHIIEEIPPLVFILILIILLVELIKNDHKEAFDKLERFWSGFKIRNRFFRWAIYSSMVAIIFIYGNEFQQFIYAQF